MALERADLVPTLRHLAQKPSPYVVPESGTPAIREVVRINHLRNCLLCHPTINRDKAEEARQNATLPVGAAPALGDATPPPFSQYCTNILVRADVAYLRQDFSAMLDEPGAVPGPNSDTTS